MDIITELVKQLMEVRACIAHSKEKERIISDMIIKQSGCKQEKAVMYLPGGMTAEITAEQNIIFKGN